VGSRSTVGLVRFGQPPAVASSSKVLALSPIKITLAERDKIDGREPRSYRVVTASQPLRPRIESFR
jgi:hypothetical protein